MSAGSRTAPSTLFAATRRGADVTFTCSPTELAAVVYGGQPLDLVAISGDRELAQRFVTLFPLPAKAEAEGH